MEGKIVEVLTDESADKLNPFQVLGINKYLVDRFPDDGELKDYVKNIYRLQIKQLHPDTQSGCKDKEKLLRMLNKAWDTIEKSLSLSPFRSWQGNTDFGASMARQLIAQENDREIKDLQKKVGLLESVISSLSRDVSNQNVEIKRCKDVENDIINGHILLTKNLLTKNSLRSFFGSKIKINEETCNGADNRSHYSVIFLDNQGRVKERIKKVSFFQKEGKRRMKTSWASNYFYVSDFGDANVAIYVGSIKPCFLEKRKSYKLNEVRPFLGKIESKISIGNCLVLMLQRDNPCYYITGEVVEFVKD